MPANFFMTTDGGQIERKNKMIHQKIFEFCTSSQIMIDLSQK